MHFINPAVSSVGASYSPGDSSARNVRTGGADASQPVGADTPRVTGHVKVDRAKEVLACRYDAPPLPRLPHSPHLPLLLPKHVVYSSPETYVERLHKTVVAWNAVDVFREGPDGTMMRLPMKMPNDTIRVLGLGSVPIPDFEGAVPDPSRRIAGMGKARGEYRMRDDKGDMAFLLNGKPVPSIQRDRGVYDLGDGKWLISRRGNEDPMSACLRMVEAEGLPKNDVCQIPAPNSLAPNSEELSQPAATPESPSMECLRMMTIGAERLPLEGLTHDSVMTMMADVLAERRCGILFTKGALRVVDEVRYLRYLRPPEDPAEPVYLITLRDPETCSSRCIKDHLEFWQDQASSAKVTPMSADWVHGADDVLLVPPKPGKITDPGSLA